MEREEIIEEIRRDYAEEIANEGIAVLDDMNECRNCGYIFHDDESDITTINHEIMYGCTLSGGYYIRHEREKVKACPHCGSTDVREDCCLEVWENDWSI